MPPVRWKLAVAVAAICLAAHIPSPARAGRQLSEDGWKPIVGHRETSYAEGMSKYRGPSNYIVEKRPSTSEPIPPPQLPPPKPTASTINNHQHGEPAKKFVKHRQRYSEMKVTPPHAKHQHYQGHAHQIPINMMTHRSQNKPPYNKAPPIMGKPHSGKRPGKPPRIQAAAAHAGNREEIFVAAPSSAIGNYAYFAQAPPPLKTRPPQAHAHIDFGNRFAPSEDFLQFQRLPVQQYVLPPKFPVPNDVHYAFQSDEYTRNLVPPLPFPEVANKKIKQKQVTEQEAKPEQMHQTSLVPENILVQVPPPFQQQQTYYVASQNEPVDVQVTKEKLNVFHNNIPVNYNPQQNDFVNFGRYQFEKEPSEAPKPPTYEVTEGKLWQQTPEFHFRYPSGDRAPGTRRPPKIVQSQVEKVVEFLPTPLKPEGSLPTSATQGEISTVYSEVSKINRQKEAAAQGDPSFYTVKEVSTHYPILGQPEFKQQFNLQLPTQNQDSSEHSSNEITTLSQQEVVAEVTTETPTAPPSPITTPTHHNRRRPVHRRRRPVRPAPEASEEQKYLDVVETTTPPPIRERPSRRRPSRYRTTTEALAPDEERPVRIRQRQRPRPTEESAAEIPQNHHRFTTEYDGGEYPRIPDGFGKYDDGVKPRRPTKHRIKQESEETSSEEEKYTIEQVLLQEPTERRPTSTFTTDQTATTNIHTPENEIDYSTVNPSKVQTITIEEIHTQTPQVVEETTTTTTTTTEVTTTTKANRLRRPLNYKSSPRPRFSLTSTTTTETSSRPSTEATPRIRYPYRSRKPIVVRYQQEPKETMAAAAEEEDTDVQRMKFVPKSPRYSTTPEPTIEERVVKTASSRLRPFGRNRPTTEATTTTQRISIKPNIFSNLRRPPQVSLRNRIFNRYSRINSTTEKTTTTTTTTSDPEDDENLENETSDVVESTEVTSTEGETSPTSAPREDRFETTDVLKGGGGGDAVLQQSQRVSDLTSSAQNDYNTPGMFKSVAGANVRRVPSYFTISTDDPILPIEAFFTNISKEKEKMLTQ